VIGLRRRKRAAERGQGEIFRRLAACLVLGYLALVVLFYFLAGDQLRYRDSRGNMALPAAEAGTVTMELWDQAGGASSQPDL